MLRIAHVAADADLVEAVEQLSARVQRRRGDDRVHLALASVDPSTWQTVELVTVAELDGVATEGAAVYVVPHLSQPAAWS